MRRCRLGNLGNAVGDSQRRKLSPPPSLAVGAGRSPIGQVVQVELKRIAHIGDGSNVALSFSTAPPINNGRAIPRGTSKRRK